MPQDQGLFEVFDSVPFCMEFMTYAVRPDEQARLAWDFYILCLVVYSSVQGPYYAAFVGEQSMHWTDYIVDMSFYCDIVLNFWTGFDKGFEVVMEKKKIVKNYLGGWFFIDFIATVNWDIIIAAIGQSDADSPLIRLMRLLKVLRLARASRLINRLTASWTLHTAFIEAAKFFFYVFMVAHLLACFFFMWPTLMTCDRTPVDVPVAMPGYFGTSGLAAEKLEPSAFDAKIQADDFTIGDADISSGEGWYFHSTCMQGSWRQGYGLERICSVRDYEQPAEYVPRDPNDEDTFIYEGQVNLIAEQDFGNQWDKVQTILTQCYVAAARDADHVVKRTVSVDGTPKTEELPLNQVCNRCMDSFRLYTDALYWSLTTMTTIGYGDRGPSTEEEIHFTFLAEVLGLSIFALLLTQINTLNEVIGESEAKKNDQKNGVVQFLKNQHLSSTLVEDTVRFLNFRAASLSGHAFAADADEFSMLSPGLIESIQNAVYRPVLERVRFFGWNKEDELENQQVKKMFDDIDTDGGGSLDRAETTALFKKLQIDLSDEQYEQVFKELDGDGEGQIDFEEFQSWWFLKKNGKPRMNKCPSLFLDALCTKLNTQPFAIREEIVHPGDYGKSLIIVLQGTVQVYRDTTEYPVILPDGKERPALLTEVVKYDDREPIVGFASCLGHSQWKEVENRTADWVVHANTYVDTAWVAREDIIVCFENFWPKGQAEMIEVAKFHYEVDVKTMKDSTDFESGPVELDGDMAERLDTLNKQLCERIADVERKVDRKLDSIIDMLQSGAST